MLDGALGRGMRKLIAATDRGRLLIYEACLKKQAELGQMENVAIVKVAHEVWFIRIFSGVKLANVFCEKKGIIGTRMLLFCLTFGSK